MFYSVWYYKYVYICITLKNKEIMTTTQKETFKSLVRLGDSKELALKTVLELSDKDNYHFYYNAYNL